MAARNWIKRLGVLAVMAGLCGIGGLGGYVWSQTVVQKQMNARSYVSGNPQIQVPVNRVQNYPANMAQIIPPNEMSGGMSPAPQQVIVPGPNGGFGIMTLPGAVSGVRVQWNKPEGEEPEWLTRGRQAIKAEDQVRKSLRQELEVSFAEAPLSTALEQILRTAEVSYTFDESFESIPRDQPVTLEIRGLVKDGIARILRPLDLDYVVRPDGLEIVEVGASHGSVRTYDLAYVVSNSGDMETVIKMVERMVVPNSWHEQGGQGVLMGIGSVLVVSTTEMVHEEVELLLGKLGEMSLQNSPRTSVPGNYPGPGMVGPGMGGAGAPLQTQLYRSGLAPAPGTVLPAQRVLPGQTALPGQPGNVQPASEAPGRYGFPGGGGLGSEGGAEEVPPAASATPLQPKKAPANF